MNITWKPDFSFQLPRHAACYHDLQTHYYNDADLALRELDGLIVDAMTAGEKFEVVVHRLRNHLEAIGLEVTEHSRAEDGQYQHYARIFNSATAQQGVLITSEWCASHVDARRQLWDKIASEYC